MPLDFQTVSIPFREGLDTKTDEKLVVPGKLVNLENGVFQEGGKIRKRFGFEDLGNEPVGSTTDFTSAEGLATYKDELILFSDGGLNSYSLSNDGWLDKGDLVSYKATSETIIDNNYAQTQQDMTINGNLVVIAWKDARGGIRATVQDNQTGARYLSDVELTSTGTKPRCIAILNFVFVFFADGGSIKFRKMNCSLPTSFNAEKSVKADMDTTNDHFDVSMYSNNLLVTYNDNSNEVHLFYYVPDTEVVGTVALGLGDEVTFSGEEAENCLNIYVLDEDTSSPTIMVAYHNTTNGVMVAARDKTLLNGFSATAIDDADLDRSDTFVDGDVTVGADTITLTAHPFTSNDRVQLTTTGTLPAGLSLATDYYVIDTDPNTIQLSLTSGPGSAVDITAAAGGGTHTITYQDPDVFRNITGVETATDTVTWFYELTATNSYDQLVKSNTITSAGSAGTTSVFKRSVGLGFEAFKNGDDTYVGLVHDSTLQSTYFTAQTDGTIIGRMHQLQAGGLTEVARLPRLHLITGELYNFASLIKGRIRIEDSTFFNLTGVARVGFNFDNKSNYAYDEIAQSLYVGGGQLSQYDGANVVESGFHLFPENVTVSQSASGGSMSDGTYSVKAVYEWVDSRGQRHRSAPSTGTSITVNGGGSSQLITVTIPTLRVTEKSDVTVHLYSTLDGGSIYYRVSSVASPTFNSTTTDSVTINRTDDDTTLGGNEILYTTGGIAENIAPPSCHIVASHNNRLYVSGLEDENAYWFSKEYTPGESISFSDLFQRRVEPEGGPIIQLASMDDKLIIFKENSIYFQAGSGPDITGNNSDFTDPNLITSDVGCVDPDSVVLMPLGLMFKSNKGVYLLDRSLSVSYAGADVEDFNGQEFTSGELIEDDNEVRFTTSESSALIYNYYFSQWSTWTNYSAVDAVVWLGDYCHVKTNGLVRKETEDAYLDSGKSVRLLIETAWLKLTGLQGFQRVRGMSVLGEYKSPHQLQVSLFYDYEDFVRHLIVFNATSVIGSGTYGSDTTYGESTVYGGDTNGVYQMRVPHLPRQKCQSIKFRFEDETSGITTGESFTLSDLTLYVGMKQGMNKLRSIKTL